MEEIRDRLIFFIILLMIFFILINFNISTKREIIFGDAGWDSIQFHNAVAGLIAENIFDYSYREIPGSSAILYEGLLSNEVDVQMELWSNNLASYEKDLKAGLFQEVSINFDDNKQGFYVPRFVIEGDEDRGIEPMAPDLKYVWDLKDYPDLFPDEEVPGKARIYGSIPGWEADEVLHKKYLHYDLDKDFRYFRPGSETALATALSSAYEKGEAIVAYYWEPTWIMGLYDFVLLEDEAFHPENYKDGETEMPPVKVTVGASNQFKEECPDFVQFLSKYSTSSELTSKALAYMQEYEAGPEETAIWFLKEYPELLDQWLSKDDSRKMKDILKTL